MSRAPIGSAQRFDPPAALDTKARAGIAQRASRTQDRRSARSLASAARAAVAGAACVIACALASGCARAPAHEATTGADTTVTFQSGVGGYSAIVDGEILSINGGNGDNEFADDQAVILVNTVDGYESEAMIRFGGLSLPAGAQITSAQVTLTFEDFFAGSHLRGYYLKAPWSPPPADLGWLNRDTGLAWNTPGAKGSGSDVVAGASFTDTNFPGTGNVTRTYPLDTATVQGWIANPATNQGILLVNEVPDRTLRVFTSEHATVANRPLLTLNYTTSGGGGTGCVTANFDQWMNQAFATQSGGFTAEFDATPSASRIDGVIGLSNGPQTTYPGLAVIPRFNPDGFIDARNGGSYAAVASVPYTGGVTYHFRVVGSVASHSYSVFVRAGAGAEQTVASNYAFRTEQAAVTLVNNWVGYVDSAGGSLQVCNFVVTGDGGGSPPTGSMTAPANNATVSGTAVTVSATAADSVGVAGVQFLLDGQPLKAEDTTAPYSITWDSTTASNAGHALSARIRNTGGLTAVTSPVNVTVSNPVSTAVHPRIWLDASALASMTERAQAGDPAWTRLRAKCESWAGGTVLPPPSGRKCDNPESQCNAPDICCGYQGGWYYDAVLDNGLCYQVGKAIGDPKATSWGNKVVAVLDQMRKFDFYEGDDGYGIRNFGVGMAIGFDWVYPVLALSPSVKTAVVTSLNAWNTWYDAHGLSRNAAPLGNYFAGYYAAKAYIGLATQGDNASAADTWDDFLDLHRAAPGTRGPDSIGMHAGIASYYTSYLDGGGYPEGWQYGNLAVRNMSEPALAALTAKGLDLINDAGHPYHYPLNSSMALIAGMWPSMQYMDDRDLIHGVSPDRCPGNSVLTTDTAVSVSALLRRWGDPRASEFQSWTRTVRNLHPAESPWLDFLFWDDRNPPAGPDYTTLPRSYLSRSPTPQGTNYAMMRSDWTTSASWASLRAMAYLDAQDQSHEFPDAGALAITRGDTPFLVNPGFLDRCYTGTSAEHDAEVEGDAIYGDQQNFNTFYTSTTDGQHWYDIVIDRSPTPPRTTIGRFEDRNGYVLSRAEHLEDVYASELHVAAWSRTVVYLRPRIFVVYDRTTTTGTVDARMSWHFPPQPTQVTTPAGTSRWNVSDGTLPAPEGGFKGALTTLLPQGAQTTPVDVAGVHKLYRIEVRPQTPAADLRWLTVLDTSTTSAGVAAASVPTGLSANARGARLTWSGGSAVVLFGAGATDTPLTGTVSFVEPAAATTLIVADLSPGASYSVTAAVSGGNHSVTIQPGSGFQASDQGTLYVVIAANGAVSAGS